MMFGLEFTDKVPFKDVYITPLVRDKDGKKMSKTKGNVVDPLDLMEQYGADAVRFTLAQLAAQGRDVILSHDRFAASRAFANKIWNAARFVMMNLEDAPRPLPKVEITKLGLAERWIVSRLDDTIREVSSSIDAYEFNVAAMKLYQFIWHEFCDWYIELSKEPLKAGGEPQAGARWVLINVFDKMLRLLHPFMPFVSEEIWQVIRPYIDEQNLAKHLPIAKYPEPSATNPLSAAEEAAMNHCIEATEAINSLRSLLGWHPGQRVTATIKAEDADELETWRSYATTLAKLEALNVDTSGDRTVFSHLTWADVGLDAPDGFDFDVARQKVQKQLEEVSKHLAQHEARLNDPRFMAKADPETRAEVAQRFEELLAQRRLLTEQLRQLEERARKKKLVTA
jgi:valyl-tRNA synthetase